MSVEELFNNGYTIIPSVINEELCDNLKKYLNDKFNEDLPYNYFKGHYQINLPNSLENFPDEIVFNNKIHNLLQNALGKNYYMYSYTCNANLASQHQPYHMDCTHFHPISTIKKFGSPGPPIQVIVNIYLQDTDDNNGSFEIVPKSHLITDFEMNEDGEIDEKYIKNPIRCNFPKGSVIIRDKRTWHRGTKNNTDKVRYMVGTSYSMNWYKLNNLTFKKECETIFYDAPFSTWNLKFN
tara:strand:- start:125 stop:838 length:714 start_codon:yes stop_codon:yes gene_type:complete